MLLLSPTILFLMMLASINLLLVDVEQDHSLVNAPQLLVASQKEETSNKNFEYVLFASFPILMFVYIACLVVV